jgi:hypothetical protein
MAFTMAPKLADLESLSDEEIIVQDQDLEVCVPPHTTSPVSIEGPDVIDGHFK